MSTRMNVKRCGKLSVKQRGKLSVKRSHAQEPEQAHERHTVKFAHGVPLKTRNGA
jgi:hypothetical protein